MSCMARVSWLSTTTKATMASQLFAKILLILHLATTYSVDASPLADCAKLLNYTGSEVTLQNISNVLLPLHHVERRSSIQLDDKRRKIDSSLQQTEDLLRLAALLPAETLQLVRKVAVPLLNTSLAVPASILEGAAKFSLSDLNPANWTTNMTSWMNVPQIISLPSHQVVKLNSTVVDGKVNATVFDKLITPIESFFGLKVNVTQNVTVNTLPTNLKNGTLLP